MKKLFKGGRMAGKSVIKVVDDPIPFEALKILKREFDFSFKKTEVDGSFAYEVLFIRKGNHLVKSYVSISLDSEDEFNTLREALK